MSKLFAVCIGASILALGGCSAVSSTVGTSFQIAQGLGSLGVWGAKQSIMAVDGGIRVAKGGLDVAGGAVQLLDQSHEASHRSRMRNLEYARAVDASWGR